GAQSVANGFRDRVTEAVGTNPGRITALLEAMQPRRHYVLQEEQIKPGPDEVWPFPERVAEGLHWEVEHQAPPIQRLIGVAAALGEPASAQVWEVAWRAATGEALDMAMMEASEWLSQDGDGRWVLRPRWLTRVGADFAPARRVLHQTITDWLEADRERSNRHVTERCHHLRCLMDQGETRPEWLRRRAIAEMTQGDTLLVAGRLAAACRSFEAAMEVFETLGDASEKARALGFLACCEAWLKPREHVLKRADAAVQTLPADGSPVARAEVLTMAAKGLEVCGAPDLAHAMLKEARRLYAGIRRKRQRTRPMLPYRIHYHWGGLHLKDSSLVPARAALSALRQAHALAVRNELPSRTAFGALVGLGRVNEAVDRYDEALKAYEQGAAIEGITVADRVWAYSARGRLYEKVLQKLGDAELAYDAAVKEATQAVWPGTYWHAWNNRGLLRAWRGRFPQGAQDLQDAESLARAQGEQQGLAEVLLHQAMAAWMAGELAAAREAVALALQLPNIAPEVKTTLHCYDGLAALDQGDPSTALTAFQRALVLASDSRDRWIALMGLALHSLLAGSPDAPIEHNLATMSEVLPQCDRRLRDGQPGGFRPALHQALSTMLRLKRDQDWAHFLTALPEALEELRAVELRGWAVRLTEWAVTAALTGQGPAFLQEDASARKALRNWLTDAHTDLGLMHGVTPHLGEHLDELLTRVRACRPSTE
ncbi:MAG: hypothetical protein ACYCW6_32500, partial [Candidatus Xenobia bacterium]